jgi:hypothetical protein
MYEFKRTLEWANAFLENEEYSRDTYEDTCGTGDMDEDERKDLYDAMESSINLFRTIKYAVEQQLNNEWVPVTERLPEKSDSYRVTKMCEDEENPIYETCNEIFWTKDNKWDSERDDLCEWKVIAWKFKEEPYKIL